MSELTTKRETLQAQTPSTPAAIAETGKGIKAIDQEIEVLEEYWLTLNEQIDAEGIAPTKKL